MLCFKNYSKLFLPPYKTIQNRVQHYHKPTLFLTPDDNAKYYLTSVDVANRFAHDIVGTTRTYSPTDVESSLNQRRKLMELLPQSVDELPKRRMKDSFVTAVVPLKSQMEFRERYVTYEGHVRIGRLLEDMDIFSVYCSFKHILNPRSQGQRNPYSVVTALVDSLHLEEDVTLRANEDIRISGHVSYVGKSSIETSLLVDQKDEEGMYRKVLDAVFLMVARDPLNKGAALVNPLVGEEEQELVFLKGGQERQATRKTQELDSLSRKPPNEEERHLIHNIFIDHISSSSSNDGMLIRGMGSDKGEIRMEDTALKTMFICHPQYRNRYNKVFGGFIMRQACELAFTNTFLYVKRRPKLVYIDDIIFRRPVEIGSILRYTSHIGYVQDNFIHCPVRAEVINPLTGECQLTNVFQFTFKVDGVPPPLAFDTYREAMVYLESRRHFQKMMDSYPTRG